MARRSGTFSRGRMTAGRTLQELRELGEHVVSAAKQALKEGADEVVTDAKSRCPVKTGKLRDSIQAIPNRDKTAYAISANAKNANGIAYGVYVEFAPKINKPFLYPAMDAQRDNVNNKIRDAIKQAINTGH